jgi:AAA+ superfamily predicted ATPase
MKPTLRHYFNASFPVIFIDTLDVDGAVTECNKITKDIADSGTRRGSDGSLLNQWFGTWTWTRYLVIDSINPVIDVDGKSLTEVNHKLLFEQALEFIRDATEPHTVIFQNIRGMFQQMKTVQLLIDAADAARQHFCHIVFAGHYFELPVELQNIVQLYEMPLPDKNGLVDLCYDRILLPNIEQASSFELPDKWEVLDDDALKQGILNLNKEYLTNAARAASGLDPVGAENAFALSITMAGGLDPDVITEQKRQIVRKSDVLEFIPLEETMDSVGGFDHYQEWLRRRSGSFTDDAKEFGVTPPKGVLFVGPPGTGKSLCAKATASALQIPLLRFDMSRVFGSLVGQSESRMRGALKVAEAIAPCCLWLDELEKSISGSKGGEHDSGVSARVLGQFLQWRAETKADIFVCCTSNNIHAVPPEFYRPGRIDAIFYVGNPDLKGRIEILAIHLRKRGRDLDGLNLITVANATEGFTGAEIELVVVEAIFTAFSDGRVPLTTELLVDAARNIVPQSKRNKEEMRELEDWAKDRAVPVAKQTTQTKVKTGRQLTAM